MSIPEPVKRIVCARCGMSVNPLVNRYLWVGYGWRGARSNREQARATGEQLLCGPCGADVIHELARQGILAVGREFTT